MDDNFFVFEERAISFEKLRGVVIKRSSPAGGFPYADEAVLHYQDGQDIYVPVKLAEALLKHLDPDREFEPTSKDT